MSTDDKKKGLDDSVETPKDDTAASDTPETIDDAQILSETAPDDAGGDAPEATGEDAVPEAVPVGEGVNEDPAPSTAPDMPGDAAVEGASAAEAVPADDSYGDTAEQPEPTPEPTPVPAAPEAGASATAGAGVLSTVAGGALAAILGFGAAQFIDVDWMHMTGLGKDPVAAAIETHNSELTALRSRLDEVEAKAAAPVETAVSGITTEMTNRFSAVSGTVETLNGQVAKLNEAVTGTLSEARDTLEQTGAELTRVADGLGAIETRLSGVGDHLAGLDERLAEVDTRLVAVEKRPLVESSDTAKAAFEVYERQLDDLRATLEAQRADAAKLEDAITEVSATASAQMTAVSEQAEAQLLAMRSQTEEELQAVRDEAAKQVEAAEARAAEAEAQAEARAQLAVAQASLAQVEAALNAGIAYEVALPALAAVTEVPDVIAENGATGIPTVLMLQESYTPAARAALTASVKDTMGDDPTTRIMAFLKTQTGVRSLEARDGDDPDAVLSRMTVAVEAGDLATALSEVAKLPEAGQQALAEWTADAQARLDAEAALPELAASVNNS